MSNDYSSAEKYAAAADAEKQQANPDRPCSCEELKQSIADRLCRAAEALDKTAAEQEENSDLAEFEKHAAQWLNQSAEYIREFDYEHEQANLRNHITQNPGRSMAIAGGVGLVLGILLRKR